MEPIKLERQPCWDVLINGEVIFAPILAKTEQEAIEQCEKYNSAFARAVLELIENGKSVALSARPHKANKEE